MIAVNAMSIDGSSTVLFRVHHLYSYPNQRIVSKTLSFTIAGKSGELVMQQNRNMPNEFVRVIINGG